MKYEDVPDYDLLQNVFRTAITRRAYKDADPFDWEREGNGVENEQPVQINTVPPAPQPTSLNAKVSVYVVHRPATDRGSISLSLSLLISVK